ncbi:MAG: hypothetical protein M1837_001707 [Sclerophora amabilis]|nr:MAG: hypothetical protein M1837_001707 [Sclerophora amabilis]
MSILDATKAMGPQDEAAFQEASDYFLQWFLRHDGATISPKIMLVDMRSRGAGRGIVALADIEEDEEIFSTPREAILTIETSKLDKEIPGILDGLDTWLALILVMVYEYLKGEKSNWKPYFDILPEQFDTLMYWSAEELDLLQASAVVEKIGMEEANEQFRKHIVPRTKSMIRCIPRTTVKFEDANFDIKTLQLAHRMGSLILAYAFDLEKDRDGSSSEEGDDGYATDEDEPEVPNKGMIPLADMLNADADRNNARLFHEELSLTMRALKPIKHGEEVFNDYGPLPRSDLLRRYGYVTKEYAQYDVVELSKDLIVSACRTIRDLDTHDFNARTEHLLEHGLLDDAYDLCYDFQSHTVFPEDLLVVVNTLLLPENIYTTRYAERALPKPKLEQTTVMALSWTLEHRLEQYETSIEEDEALLKEESTGRREMAIEVRLGEKRILREGLQELRATISTPSDLNTLKRGPGEGASHSPKSAKMA